MSIMILLTDDMFLYPLKVANSVVVSPRAVLSLVTSKICMVPSEKSVK